jgi:hypothetical protein
MLNDIEDDDLLEMYNPITNNFEKPKHKYNGKIPMIAILFDDVVGSMLFTPLVRIINFQNLVLGMRRFHTSQTWQICISVLTLWFCLEDMLVYAFQ